MYFYFQYAFLYFNILNSLYRPSVSDLTDASILNANSSISNGNTSLFNGNSCQNNAEDIVHTSAFPTPGWGRRTYCSQTLFGVHEKKTEFVSSIVRRTMANTEHCSFLLFVCSFIFSFFFENASLTSNSDHIL